MKKYTIEHINELLNKEGYTLLSTEYENCKSKLQYKCPVGHEHEMSLDKWLSGRRCYYCNGNIKLSTEFVRSELLKDGYTLLSDYKNSRTRFKFQCDKGHIGYMKWDHWRDGHRCAECAGTAKIDKSIVLNALDAIGYKLIDVDYIKGSNRIKYICDEGHYGYTTWYNFNTLGIRCLECSGKSKKTIEFIKDAVEKDGYILLSDTYINCNQKLHLICPNGHDYYVSWDNWNHSKSRCPFCKDWGTSYQEKELVDLFTDNTTNIIKHSRNLISPYELDIVVLDKKIAIEYCGLYWHSELAGKGRNYHLNKLKLCQEKGYRLITIFEDEWLHKRDIVISRLNNVMNLNSKNSVYARNCIIKEIDSAEASLFINSNHLQGYGLGSNIKLGLFYKDELLSVMTFAKPSISKGHRGKKYLAWELQRFCSKQGVNVIGGASKLLKYFERNYEWNQIFSYADRRWSDGNLYEKLGFKFDGYTKPNYWYLNKQKRIHRFALRKTKDDPKDQTEWEIRKSQGWNRIWDCGNLRYIKNNNE